MTHEAQLIQIWLRCGVLAFVGVLALSGQMPLREGLVSRGMWRAFGGACFGFSLGSALLAAGFSSHHGWLHQWLVLGGCAALLLGVTLLAGTLGYLKDNFQRRQTGR